MVHVEDTRRRSRLPDPSLRPSPSRSATGWEKLASPPSRPDLRINSRRAVVDPNALAQIESMGRVLKEARLRDLALEATARAEEEEEPDRAEEARRRKEHKARLVREAEERARKEAEEAAEKAAAEKAAAEAEAARRRADKLEEARRKAAAAAEAVVCANAWRYRQLAEAKRRNAAMTSMARARSASALDANLQVEVCASGLSYGYRFETVARGNARPRSAQSPLLALRQAGADQLETEANRWRVQRGEFSRDGSLRQMHRFGAKPIVAACAVYEAPLPPAERRTRHCPCSPVKGGDSSPSSSFTRSSPSSAYSPSSSPSPSFGSSSSPSSPSRRLARRPWSATQLRRY